MNLILVLFIAPVILIDNFISCENKNGSAVHLREQIKVFLKNVALASKSNATLASKSEKIRPNVTHIVSCASDDGPNLSYTYFLEVISNFAICLPLSPSEIAETAAKIPKLGWISKPLREGLADLKVRSQTNKMCNLHMDLYEAHLQINTLWAVRMAESSQSELVGLLSGTNYQMGNFEECINTKSQKYGIKGKYCLANFKYRYSPKLTAVEDFLRRKYSSHEIPNNNAILVEKNQDITVGQGLGQLKADPARIDRQELHWAICIPESCSSDDLALSLEKALLPRFEEYNFEFSVTVDPISCTVAHDCCWITIPFIMDCCWLPFTFPIGFWITIIFFAILGIINIAATSFDAYYYLYLHKQQQLEQNAITTEHITKTDVNHQNNNEEVRNKKNAQEEIGDSNASLPADEIKGQEMEKSEGLLEEKKNVSFRDRWRSFQTRWLRATSWIDYFETLWDRWLQVQTWVDYLDTFLATRPRLRYYVDYGIDNVIKIRSWVDYNAEAVAERKGFWREILGAFSTWGNVHSLIFQEDEDARGRMQIINFIKVFMMLAVIFGHLTMYAFGNPQFSPENLEQLYHQDIFMAMGKNTTVVDVFLMLSGFLAFYFGYNQIKDGGAVYLVQKVIFRYLRLIPAFAIVIAYVAFVLPHTNTGPIWNSIVTAESENCRKNWWLNLLLLNNLVNVDEQCISISWYVTIDILLYFLATIVMYLMSKSRVFRLYLPSLVFVVSMATTFWVVYSKNFSGIFKVYMSTLTDVRKNVEYRELYVTLCSRVGPYLVGLLTGFYTLRLQQRNFTFSTRNLIIGTIIFGAISAGSIFYGVAFYWLDRPTFAVENAFYASIQNTLYVLVFAWFLLAFVTTGFGSGTEFFGDVFIGDLLKLTINHKVFTILSRISYSVFIVHLIVLMTLAASVRTPIFYSELTILTYLIGTTAMAYACAFGFYLFVEAPFSGVARVFEKYYESYFQVKVSETKEISASDKQDGVVSSKLEEKPENGVVPMKLTEKPKNGVVLIKFTETPKNGATVVITKLTEKPKNDNVLKEWNRNDSVIKEKPKNGSALMGFTKKAKNQ